eukprot:scaffold12071_cov15-Tisochrysis_lutea.AAC.1
MSQSAPLLIKSSISEEGTNSTYWGKAFAAVAGAPAVAASAVAAVAAAAAAAGSSLVLSGGRPWGLLVFSAPPEFALKALEPGVHAARRPGYTCKTNPAFIYTRKGHKAYCKVPQTFESPRPKRSFHPELLCYTYVLHPLRIMYSEGLPLFS